MATKQKPAAKPINGKPVVVAPEVKATAIKQQPILTTKTEKPVVVAAKPIKPSIAPDASPAIIEKMIVSIRARGAKMDNDIQSTGVACLSHLNGHRDITLLNRLVVAMPKSSRRNALVVWALKNSGGMFLLNDDAKTREGAPLVVCKTPEGKAAKCDIAAAVGTPFWEAGRNVREGGPEFVFSDYIGSITKKLQQIVAKGPEADRVHAKAILAAMLGVEIAIDAPSPVKAYAEGEAPVRRSGDPKPAAVPAIPEALH